MYRELTKTKRPIAPKTAGGFTISEVVVAGALLAISIVPILKGLTRAHLDSVTIEHKTHSLILAQAKLDEIKVRSIYNYSNSFAESSTSLDGSYLCTVTDTAVNSDLRNISVSVGYDFDSNGTLGADEVSVSLTSLIAKRWDS